MKFSRRIRYYCLRFVRLRGDPADLALGIAFGIFAGMMPIMPFQIALAVTLAIFFKGSKITAAIGTWVSNPLNWYFLYFYSYKVGAFILGLSAKNKGFASVMESMPYSDETTAVVVKFLSAGSNIIAAFLIGGFVMGSVAAVPSYFIFLKIFRTVRDWRERRRIRKRLKRTD